MTVQELLEHLAGFDPDLQVQAGAFDRDGALSISGIAEPEVMSASGEPYLLIITGLEAK